MARRTGRRCYGIRSSRPELSLQIARSPFGLRRNVSPRRTRSGRPGRRGLGRRQPCGSQGAIDILSGNRSTQRSLDHRDEPVLPELSRPNRRRYRKLWQEHDLRHAGRRTPRRPSRRRRRLHGSPFGRQHRAFPLERPAGHWIRRSRRARTIQRPTGGSTSDRLGAADRRHYEPLASSSKPLRWLCRLCGRQVEHRSRSFRR